MKELKRHKATRYWDGSGPGIGICGNLIGQKQLTKDWRRVTCKVCLKMRDKVASSKS